MSALHATGRRAEALRAFDRARRTLATELGISPGTELVRLHRSCCDDDDEPDPARATRPRTGRLPTAVSSIVGRDELLDPAGNSTSADGRARHPDRPGRRRKDETGVGVCGTAAVEVSGDGWWVDLAATRQAEAVEPVIASTLGIGVNIGTTREQIIGAIGDRHLLLVIDNCEHVLAPVTALVTAVLAACPPVEVLATSREPLAVAGERTVAVYRRCRSMGRRSSSSSLVPAKPTPRSPPTTPWRWRPSPAASTASPWQSSSPQPASAHWDSPTSRHASTTVSISSARPGAGPDTRYHTMRAALDWSYDLLDPTERVVFEQLAVFRGRFELEAVEGVVSASPDHAAVIVGVAGRQVDGRRRRSRAGTVQSPRAVAPVRRRTAARERSRRRHS